MFRVMDTTGLAPTSLEHDAVDGLWAMIAALRALAAAEAGLNGLAPTSLDARVDDIGVDTDLRRGVDDIASCAAMRDRPLSFFLAFCRPWIPSLPAAAADSLGDMVDLNAWEAAELPKSGIVGEVEGGLLTVDVGVVAAAAAALAAINAVLAEAVAARSRVGMVRELVGDWIADSLDVLAASVLEAEGV